MGTGSLQGVRSNPRAYKLMYWNQNWAGLAIASNVANRKLHLSLLQSLDLVFDWLPTLASVYFRLPGCLLFFNMSESSLHSSLPSDSPTCICTLPSQGGLQRNIANVVPLLCFASVTVSFTGLHVFALRVCCSDIDLSCTAAIQQENEETLNRLQGAHVSFMAFCCSKTDRKTCSPPSAFQTKKTHRS